MNVKLLLLIVSLSAAGLACGGSGAAAAAAASGGSGGSESSNSVNCVESALTLNEGETEKAALVSWDQNRESDVNKTGGGYRVYYCQGYFGGGPGSDCPAGFLGSYPENYVENVNCKDVPFVSGPAAPTNTTLQVKSGSYLHVRVQAYSAINDAGGDISNKWTINVP